MDGISLALHKQQTNPFPHMPSSSPHNAGQYVETDNDEELSIVTMQKIDITKSKNLKTICIQTKNIVTF
jgi:hypothetical protein